jgi:glyoxylase-like metal-dependent hydrolase (beta-lactamase superfamily II)
MTATAPLHRSRPGAEAIRPASAERAVAVAPRVWMSPGLSNSYSLGTDEHRVIVNTGTSFESLVHRSLFDAVDPSPTRYIVVTQGHPDHTGGVDVFRDPGSDIVAQAAWRIWRDDFDRLIGCRSGRASFAWGEQMQTGIAQIAARFGLPLPPQPTFEPTLLVTDHLTLDLGGRRIEIHSTPGGETTDSLVVWLPDDGVCLTGNLFGPLFGHLPNLVTIRGDRYRDALLYLDSLELVRALQPEVLLTGHFDPVVGGAVIDDELRRMGDAVRHLHDETVRLMNEGADVHTAMRLVTVPPELEVGEGYGKASWNVRAIWETYTGWFHHRSTTELYDVPASSVAADLVELAGADAIAQRAAQRLDAGRPIDAIHLAELVAGLPTGRALLARAHRALLSEATNFWECAWLQAQIEELER